MGRLTIEEIYKNWADFRTMDWVDHPDKVADFINYCTTWGYDELDVNKFLKKKNIAFETGRLQERVL